MIMKQESGREVYTLDWTTRSLAQLKRRGV